MDYRIDWIPREERTRPEWTKGRRPWVVTARLVPTPQEQTISALGQLCGSSLPGSCGLA